MKLVYKGHKALESVAEEVEMNENVSQLLINMWSAMSQGRGIGLAANQVGVLKRIIVIGTKNLTQAIINPVITKAYGGKVRSREGCLSFPGLQVSVWRDRNIVVEGYDQHWVPIKLKSRGIQSIVIQHEIDHLNGITLENRK